MSSPRALGAPRVNKGAGLLAGVVLAFVALAPAAAMRQPPCDLSGSGCALGFDEPVSAALTDPSDAHIWWIGVRIVGSFRVELTSLPGDYRLYVYAPDGSVAGQSSNRGLVDEVIDVSPAEVGDYAVFVDSPQGETSNDVYWIAVTWTGENPIPPPPTRPAGPVQTATPPRATPEPVRTPESAPVTPGPSSPTPESAPDAEATPTPSPPRPPGASTQPTSRPTTGPTSPPATAAPTVPSTCTTPAVVLARTAVRSDEAIDWEAHGFRPGSTVRVQAFADGTDPVSDLVVAAVNSECVAGLSGGEIVVTAVPRARYYVLRVTGSRYGTGAPLSLIGRFSVSTVPR